MRIDTNLQLIDERFPLDKIFWKENVSLCYTLKSDDITKCERLPDYTTPYTDRTGEFVCDGERWVEKATGAVLNTKTIGAGIEFTLQCDNDSLSEWGINLPFNFMGKKNGGGWENQFLFNSPYISEDKKILYAYLTKPNGANLMVAVLGGVEGWKMDYSPYLGGHYFVGLKILANFDKAYNTARRKNAFTVAL